MIKREDAISIIKAEYSRLDCITGVDTSQIEVKLSSRMTRKLGLFKYEKKGLLSKPKLCISISDKLLPYDDAFWDCIRHEYAHAVVYLRDPKNSHGHDAVWKSVCREVGCIPRASRKDLKIAEEARPYKYQVVCESCGAVSNYKTKSKVVKLALKELRGYLVCKRCGKRKFKCIIIEAEASNNACIDLTRGD